MTTPPKRRSARQFRILRIGASLLIAFSFSACSSSSESEGAATPPPTSAIEVVTTPTTTATADPPATAVDEAEASADVAGDASADAGASDEVPATESDPAIFEVDQLDEGARLACANAELALFDLREAAPEGAAERVLAAAEWAADSEFEEFKAFSTELDATNPSDDLEVSLQEVLSTCEEHGYERF